MNRLVDYFVVCGLHCNSLERELTTGSSYTPPLIRGFPPKILCRYPERERVANPFDESAVATLCMPDGLKFKKNLNAPSDKAIHTFCITRENGSRIYGTVLTFYEQTTNLKIINSFEAFQSKYLENRTIQLHTKQDINFTRSKDRLYAPKCLCLVTLEPIFQPLKRYLEQLYAITVGGLSGDLPLECYLFNLLYEVTLPPPGGDLRFMGPLGALSLSLPSQSDLPPCDYSFRDMFELLGVNNVVRLVTCLLLEHQVLLKASDLERLSLVSHCAVALLWPFSWPHVFVPFLPASQRGFLDAPVPYLMGLRVDSSQESDIYSDLSKMASLCTVDIDTGELECPDEVPTLPDEGRLLLYLSEKIIKHKVRVNGGIELPRLPQFSPPPKSNVLEDIRLGQDNLKDSNKKLKKILSDSAILKEHIPNLINISQRCDLKSPTVSLDEGTYDLDDEDHTHQASEWDWTADKSEQAFSTDVREVFAEYLVECFINYEKFIIVPKQSFEQWQSNREQFQNFDKTAYLSDQPLNSQEFYSALLETSIFSVFVDDKISSVYQPETCRKCLAQFDARIDQHRERSGLANPPPTPGYRSISISSEGDEDEDNLPCLVVENAPPPHVIFRSDSPNSISSLTSLTPPPPSSPSPPANSDRGGFPELDSALLRPGRDILLEPSSPEPPSSFSPSSSSSSLSHRSNSGSSGSSRGVALGKERTPHSRPSSAVNHHRKLKQTGGMSTFLFSSKSHAKFVSQLMRESRLRVKHMLGSSRESETTIEENTHIASLCDLLERIWGHGLKKRESKSPLWAHLKAYAETVAKKEFEEGASPERPVKDRHRSASLYSSMSSLTIPSTSMNLTYTDGASGGEVSPRTSRNIKSHFRRKKFQSPQLRSSLEAILQPSPSSLVSDLLVVHNMHELKTDVGRARGWVRLALEKKSLSRHLSELLSHEELTSRRYREYAFIRTDEEREQFLYHLLTLTAREFSCFTTGYCHTTMKYHVLVVAEGKYFGLNTACLYVNLSGEFRETGVKEIPRGECQIEFEHENIGPQTCLRVGHDNSGLAPSLLVEMVLVHNVTTGQVYRFNCGRMFAYSDDDGSISRFLLAEKVPLTFAKSGTTSALDVDTVLPASPGGRRRMRKKSSEEWVYNPKNLNLELKLIMDKMRTLALNKRREKIEMLKLIHGRSGFIECMENILSAGFKTGRKFSKKLHFWDLLERINESLLAEDESEESGTTISYYGAFDPAKNKNLFMMAVSRIGSNSPTIGKDEKVSLFLCLGLRDHLLKHWLAVVAGSSLIAGYYEVNSYLRDPVLLQNLLDSFQLTRTLSITLDPLFTQGLT